MTLMEDCEASGVARKSLLGVAPAQLAKLCHALDVHGRPEVF